jgi:decaprenylphospho-beta-D-ribofuranose 2-oxidase
MKAVPLELSGWGNYPKQTCLACQPADRQALQQSLADSADATFISRGLGRAYGDSALIAAPGIVISQTWLNRFISFDATTGILECEAGVSFAEIIQFFLPRGWFLPTTPGTKFVTVGGAIAADVHGKNHHQVGSFGRFVLQLRLLLSDGSEVVCSPQERSEIFWATIGGMGLTGIITTARIQLARTPTAYVKVNYRRTANLDDTLRVFSEADHQHQYSVAWIDCLARGESLGRSVVMLADDAALDDLPLEKRDEPLVLPRKTALDMPINCPSILMAPWSTRIFNKLYYAVHGDSTKVVDFDSFFYPLDRIAQWNRLYGRRGFAQYQAWFPRASSARGLAELLERIAATQRASFLAVLKSCGERDDALLTYLEPGHTLALDFPYTGDDLQVVFSQLDQILLLHGGRLYLAKDSMTTAETFHEMYTRLQEFRDLKATIDPHNRFNSSQARRLKIV